MEKKLWAGLATGLFLFAMVGMAQAIPLTTVGAIDTLRYQADLGNSGDATELAWINSSLSSSFSSMDKYDVVGGEWLAVDGMSGVFAHGLNNDPTFFMIKTGNLQLTLPDRHFLFQNNDILDWAVIDFGILGWANTDKVSHIAEVGDGDNPVPEPTTMLLMGTGLAGLAAARRKRKA